MARLALGLRTRLQNDAGNVEGWLMLGRIGMVLGNAGTATGAYANAYRLDPKNRDAALGYAEALNIKKFWSLTAKGCMFGKNITSPANPRETQPHFFESRFPELLKLLDTVH